MPLPPLSPARITRGKIFLRNASGYSAKNPAVIVRFQAMAFRPGPDKDDPDSFIESWTVIDSLPFYFAGRQAYTAIQWDGGSAYSIHGYSTRRLPDLIIFDLWHIPGGWELGRTMVPALTVEILAEGYRKVVTLPVDMKHGYESFYPREKILPEWV